jgi:hypothetical protein
MSIPHVVKEEGELQNSWILDVLERQFPRPVDLACQTGMLYTVSIQISWQDTSVSRYSVPFLCS